METEIAYQQYLVTAQQNAEYMNTLLWIFFIFVVIAPLILAIIYITVGFITRPRCPNCGNRKLKISYENIKEDDPSLSVPVLICPTCKADSKR